MHINACTGMSLNDIADQFDLPRLDALYAYHKKFPPLHIMVAAYLGAGESKPTSQQNQPDLFAELAQFPGGVFVSE